MLYIYIHTPAFTRGKQSTYTGWQDVNSEICTNVQYTHKRNKLYKLVTNKCKRCTKRENYFCEVPQR